MEGRSIGNGGRGVSLADARCIACREPIRPGAKICPHCRTPQQRERMKLFGSVLKWTGGITAVISLVIGSASVYELYTGWRERKVAVAELVEASKIQLTSHDYEGGWLLLRQALELEPASEAARRFQVPFAMEWLRHARVPEGKSFADVVDPLLPVLYRGVTAASKSAAADVYAHIGWANYLKRRSGNYLVEIDGHFRRALELDAYNVYANVFWGHWTLNRLNEGGYGEAPIVKAGRHFDAALNSGRDTDFVVNLMLAALLDSGGVAVVREALGFLNRLREANIAIPPARLSKVALIFHPVGSQDREYAERKLAELTEAMPARDLRRIFDWAADQLPPAHGSQRAARRYVGARLAEAAGDKAGALAVYRALVADETTGEAYIETVVRPAIDRVNAAPR